MIKITNGVDVFEVSRGAYEGIYFKQGYSMIGVKETNQDDTADSGEVSENEPSTELSEDDKFCAELLEKPLNQWNKEEVKKFAEINSIDITGTKNANEAKERIKAFLDAE